MCNAWKTPREVLQRIHDEQRNQGWPTITWRDTVWRDVEHTDVTWEDVSSVKGTSQLLLVIIITWQNQTKQMAQTTEYG